MKQIVWALALIGFAGLVLLPGAPVGDARLSKALRRPDSNGWIFVHLEGSPAAIGFQHGYLLAPEIREAHKRVRLSMTHDSGKPYSFMRHAAEEIFWPRIEKEYREELQGIADGLKARKEALDLWDVVTMNAWIEISGYYLPWLDGQRDRAAVAERCSAFVATGSYTSDGRPVAGHNTWSGYLDGSFWNIIFDIAPARGHRILMDGYPGLIHSAADFGVNSAGLIVTETTISGFHGFDPKGIPEFVRARKAMQYSSSIDDFAGIMREGNNGGYANNWLVADRNTNEIASLELGLKNVHLRRKKDGYFAGANFPIDPKLMRDETSFTPSPD
ncbi:MAG: phospholipase B family protein, partial [Acidobacteria bacterium]|nr:phospholipase B family protein [Acidobacteriota bacterium]